MSNDTRLMRIARLTELAKDNTQQSVTVRAGRLSVIAQELKSLQESHAPSQPAQKKPSSG